MFSVCNSNSSTVFKSVIVLLSIKANPNTKKVAKNVSTVLNRLNLESDSTHLF